MLTVFCVLLLFSTCYFGYRSSCARQVANEALKSAKEYRDRSDKFRQELYHLRIKYNCLVTENESYRHTLPRPKPPSSTYVSTSSHQVRTPTSKRSVDLDDDMPVLYSVPSTPIPSTSSKSSSSSDDSSSSCSSSSSSDSSSSSSSSNCD